VAKVLCVLYDDPVDGYPRSYARDAIPRIERYHDGQTTPTPERIDFEPGELLGSVSGELGLRRFLEERGHTFVVTSDKDGPDSVFERELPDAEIVISQPFWPAYLTAERIAKAPGLKLAVTAGIGSDHVDLAAAIERGITVAEVTYSNSISVSEHVVMMILSLVRNYIPSYQWVVKGAWGSETRIRSRSEAVVLVDESAEQIPAANIARADEDRLCGRCDRGSEAEAAMGPAVVVVLDIDAERPLEMPPPLDERPVEALGPDRLDHPFGVGVGVRSPDRGADDPHPLRAEHRIEWPAELRVPVADEEPDGRRAAIEVHHEVPGLLGNPS